MTTRVINDTASLERLVNLIDYLDRVADTWLQIAKAADALGNTRKMAAAAKRAAIAQGGAERRRERLVELSGLTEGDVAVSDGLADLMQRGPLDTLPIRVPVQSPEHLTPEPPAKLMDLYKWLRSLLGSRFPWVTSESWQRVAWLLLLDRGRS